MYYLFFRKSCGGGLLATWISRPHWSQLKLFAQPEHILLPLLLEQIHVSLCQDFLQRLEPGWVFLPVCIKFLVKLHQHGLLLQVVAKIARLGVLSALAIVIISVRG